MNDKVEAAKEVVEEVKVKSQVLTVYLQEREPSDDWDIPGDRKTIVYENPQAYGVQSGFLNILKANGAMEYLNTVDIHAVVQSFPEEV